MYDYDLQYGAWVAVQKAVTSGQLVKPKCCEKCGLKKPLEFHHTGDYRQVLQGTWLCRSCHRKEHSKLKRLRFFNEPNI